LYDHASTENGGGLTAKRAVRYNVVIRVVTDSSTANDPAAGNIAAQIAVKVPSK
jgi:hypothetical protein